jgi:hypothetical protein
MEFQGVIRSASNSPLGSLAFVEGTLRRLFSGIAFEWTRSGADKLIDSDRRGITLPEIVRKVLQAQPSNRCGAWSDDLITVTFCLGNREQVECIWLTVSGDDAAGDRILGAMSRIPEWTIDGPESLCVSEVHPNAPVTITENATLFVEKESAD